MSRTAARRFLLGEASEEERAAVEQEYFADERALERMEAAEEDLIEDYLADRLGSDQRTLFERRYLTVPHRRRRVETIRGLMSAAQRAAPAPAARRFRAMEWASLAAAALLILVAWRLVDVSHRSRRTGRSRSACGDICQPPSRRPFRLPAATIFALSISPISVRGAGERSSLVIPAGTDVVRLHLEGEASAARVAGRPRTRPHRDRRRGMARLGGGLADDAPAGTVAQIDVPAARLAVDDYVIELFGIDASGRRAGAIPLFPGRARAHHRRP